METYFPHLKISLTTSTENEFCCGNQVFSLCALYNAHSEVIKPPLTLDRLFHIKTSKAQGISCSPRTGSKFEECKSHESSNIFTLPN